MALPLQLLPGTEGREALIDELATAMKLWQTERVCAVLMQPDDTARATGRVQTGLTPGKCTHPEA